MMQHVKLNLPVNHNIKSSKILTGSIDVQKKMLHLSPRESDNLASNDDYEFEDFKSERNDMIKKERFFNRRNS